MDTAQWTGKVFPAESQELLDLVAAANEAMGSKRSCGAIEHWAEGAETTARPENEGLAAAYDDLVEWGRSYSTEGCLTRNPAVRQSTTEDLLKVIDALEAEIRAS